MRSWTRRLRGGLVIGVGALVLAAGLVLGTGVAVASSPGYVALGDSYSSGVGTRTYIDDGTDCQRSLYAYPELDASRLGAALSFQACGGATTASVLSGQLGTLNATTTYVTITVGGNDAGFSSVIEQCAKPWPYTCTSQISTAQTFIRNTLPGRLDAVYSAIRTHAPNAHVVVVGYPRLFNGSTCNLLSRISSAEESSLNTTADLLATTTATRAAAHGFTFADARTAFTGHAICDSVEWINGLSDPVDESYHPDRAGQTGYANLVQTALTAG
jgi:lysophospholipase L1-like esterase